MSLYNVLPDRGYDIRIWTARYVKRKDLGRYAGRLAPLISNRIEQATGDELAGKSTEPSRFDDQDLMEREASYGRSGFALQFMLDTSLSDQDRYPLKINDAICMDLDKEIAPVKIVYAGGKDQEIIGLESMGFVGDRWHKPLWTTSGELGFVPYQGSVMFIDPSGRGKDETGYAIVNQLNSHLFVMDCGGIAGEGYSDQAMDFLANKAKEFQVKSIVIEDNFGDGMYLKLFKPHLNRIYKVSIDEDFLVGKRSSGQKEKRIIDVLEPVLNQHRLIFNRPMIERDITNYNSHPAENYIKYSLFYQMTRITRDKGALLHDDRLDALAGAVSYWIEKMDRDVESTERDHLEELLKVELDKHMEHLVGYRIEAEGFAGSYDFEYMQDVD